MLTFSLMNKKTTVVDNIKILPIGGKLKTRLINLVDAQFRADLVRCANPNIDLAFDNGGGVTIQTVDYCHFYQSPVAAAVDYSLLWQYGSALAANLLDYNESQHRLDYDVSVEQSGGYRWFSAGDVELFLKVGLMPESGGSSQNTFFDALGCRRSD